MECRLELGKEQGFIRSACMRYCIWRRRCRLAGALKEGPGKRSKALQRQTLMGLGIPTRSGSGTGSDLGTAVGGQDAPYNC